jgi:hypothetical protein
MTWWEYVYNTGVHALPAILGAISSSVFTKGSFPRRLVMVPIAGFFAYYGGEHSARILDMPASLTGYFIGIACMPILDKFFTELHETKVLQPIINAIATRIQGKENNQ